MASNDLPSREDLQAAAGDLTEMATKEQPLVLNPEDVKVDDTLPPYYGNTKVNGLMDYASGVKPPTNEEISQAIETRKVARKKVNGIFKNLIDTEASVKTDIKNKWDKSKPDAQKSMQETLNTFKLPEYKELINFLKSELVWWDNNKKSYVS